MQPSARILLLSTSTLFGGDYLDYAEDEIRDFLGATSQVLFVPFALHDHSAYAGRVRKRFTQMGYALESLHQATDAAATVDRAEAVFIGGGNTFRLLSRLYDLNLLAAIRDRVGAGMPYLGSSAGSNVAGLTIKTTNDMPIMQPPCFDSLGLVPFQINPHYLDPDPNSRHMGETREERIREFLEENATPVIGLREGAWLRIEHGAVVLKGNAGARLFRRKLPPVELQPGSIDRFLGSSVAGVRG